MAAVPERADAPRVFAAGVVAVRGVGKRREVLVLHRPDRDDWSLPKGKVDPGERLAAAAVRETWEETGLRVTLGVPLPTIRYRVVDPRSDSPRSARKAVHYWRANVLDDAIAAGDRDLPEGWAPNDEVDELRWVRVSRLPGLLTYPHDLEVVDAALQAPAHTSPFMLLRHAQAEKRPLWRAQVGDEPSDQLRPLVALGEAQALAMVDVLAAYGITNVASSSAVRCMATVQPYADRLGVAVDALPSITEEAFAERPKRGVREILGLLESVPPTVVCIHRPTKKRLMRAISREVEQEVSLALAPAEYVVVHRAVRCDDDGHPQRVRLGLSSIIEVGAHH